ncbi:MAG: hypothetical protein WC809_21315 [Sinimarinibacterium sp.]|jgi:lysophospholipase L1-like esterase
MKKQWPRSAATRVFWTAVCSILSVSLSACDGSNGPDDPDGAGGPDGSSSGAIFAWGDSWTSGVGAIDGESFPDQLQSLTGRTVYNGGVSGQTSDQIAARQGGAPALLTLPGNMIPGSGPVTIQNQSTFPVSAEGPGPITGTLGGVHGMLSFNGNLVFERDDSGAPVAVPAQSPFDPDTYGSQSEINVFWLGGNNFYDPAAVKSDIAKSVAFLFSNKYIVLGLLNAGSEPIGSDSYALITQLNADLAGGYPNNFINIRKILVDSYDSSQPQDVIDHRNDVTPSSLRNDDVHLNEAGYAIIAQQVAAFIRSEGW